MSDLSRLDGLRQRAGATQNTLDAWELENGCCPRDLRLIEQHNALLRMNQESKDWLSINEAVLTGRQNFFPQSKAKKTKTTKHN